MARREYAEVLPVVESLRDEGKSLRMIAQALTEQGFTTRTGVEFSAVQVSRLLK